VGGRRLTSWIDEETGEEMLDCRGPCGEDKPLTEFPSFSDGKIRGMCRACLNARKKRYYEEGRFTRSKEKAREYSRRSHERNRAKRLQQHREYLARVKADPARHARFLAARRMEYRLRKERGGVSLGDIRSGPTRYEERDGGRAFIPSAPLVALVDNVLELRNINGEATLGEVCSDLRVEPRRLRDWRRGATNVTLAVAERAVLAAGVEFESVWSPAEFPELYVAGGPLSDELALAA
jgi:hypothetical protein